MILYPFLERLFYAIWLDILVYFSLDDIANWLNTLITKYVSFIIYVSNCDKSNILNMIMSLCDITRNCLKQYLDNKINRCWPSKKINYMKSPLF